LFSFDSESNTSSSNSSTSFSLYRNERLRDLFRFHLSFSRSYLAVCFERGFCVAFLRSSFIFDSVQRDGVFGTGSVLHWRQSDSAQLQHFGFDGELAMERRAVEVRTLIVESKGIFPLLTVKAGSFPAGLLVLELRTRVKATGFGSPRIYSLKLNSVLPITLCFFNNPVFLPYTRRYKYEVVRREEKMVMLSLSTKVGLFSYLLHRNRDSLFLKVSRLQRLVLVYFSRCFHLGFNHQVFVPDGLVCVWIHINDLKDCFWFAELCTESFPILSKRVFSP